MEESEVVHWIGSWINWEVMAVVIFAIVMVGVGYWIGRMGKGEME